MWVPMKSCKSLVRLPNYLASVHPVFHVSMLKRCISDLESILPIEGLGVKDKPIL